MTRKQGLGRLVLGAGLALLITGCRTQDIVDSRDSVFADFRSPGAEYRSVPLWVWNDRMTRDEVEGQLKDFKDRGIGGVFIHPRPGLITPYLSQEWLDLCRFAVDTGKALGLKVWLYDENSYPSGFAGGHVPAAMPEAAVSGLRLTKATVLPAEFANRPILIQNLTYQGFQDVTKKALAVELGPGDYYIYDLVLRKPSPWYGGFTYVDIMRREVTEKFLDTTLNAYKRTLGDEFGRTVPGVFQDEAEIAPAGGPDSVSYTPALFDAFRDKWGYDLEPNLPCLFEDVLDFPRVRHDYYATLLDLLIDGWAKPYYAYCSRNNLIFTGHYWEHEWPIPRVSPDSLAMAAYAHMPGIDILMNDWSLDPHAQFGNSRAVKEIRSAASQFGRKRTLSETYGASGWDLTFFDQKRIGDWEYALGVNFLNQHLSYVTIKGARKRDHPLSFSYHEPWWKDYNLMADYFARLSVALSAGQQENRILVIEPTTTAWMAYSPLQGSGWLNSVGENFQKFIHLLEENQVEYDVVSERTLAEFGQTGYRKLKVGRRAYDLVVLPPGLENLDRSTLKLLRYYLVRGGRVLSWVAPPTYLDGRKSEDVRKLAGSYGDRWFSPGIGFDKVFELSPPDVVFSDLRNPGQLFHHRRRLKDGELLFLANSDPLRPVGGTFSSPAGAVEEWDPFTGAVKPFPHEKTADGLKVDFELQPGGSLLLCLGKEKGGPAANPKISGEEEVPGTGLEVRRESPNVLTLDACDLTLAGKTEKDLYFYDAQLKAFQHHGLERNPWDSAVQFKTNILDLDKFPADSGFEASFSFTAARGDYLAGLSAVAERPELFGLLVNGREVPPRAGEWWLDRAFGVFPIGPLVREGKNTITLRSKPFTIHSELEPVYVLGEFRLEGLDRGFGVRPAESLTSGSWAGQGMPFYGGAVNYIQTFAVPAFDSKRERFFIRLGDWRGAVAEVRVDGNAAGFIAFPPFELEVTEFLKPGENRVEVAVTGTLKNTLGPHHRNPPRGKAWPSAFQQGAEGGPPPGARYSVEDYGLFSGFFLIRRTVEE